MCVVSVLPGKSLDYLVLKLMQQFIMLEKKTEHKRCGIKFVGTGRGRQVTGGEGG